MKRYTDNELERLLDDIESDLVERKESFKGETTKKARQAVCAFANDLPNHNQPGVLFIGVKDNGQPSECKITDELLRSLADMKTDGNILPLPVLTVEKRLLKGHDIAVITVMPSDMPPVKFEGRIWVRTGSRRSIAGEQEERILIERRRYRALPYDLHPMMNTTVKDLSRVLFEQEYLPRVFSGEVLASDTRSYQEQLASCKMVDSPEEAIPTVLGVLALASKPQNYIPGAYIQFLRINGMVWGDPVIDEERIIGTLARQLEKLSLKLTSHNRVKVDYTSAAVEKRQYSYPMAALEQLTRNALMHRSYEGTNSPVMVYWFDDRIEIINAGGAFGRVTPESFGKPGYADYRNPNIAEYMKVMGLVQKFGVGIQTAQRELERNGNPALEFEVSMTSVICRVKAVFVPEVPELATEKTNKDMAGRIILLLSQGEKSKSELAFSLGQKAVSGALKKQIATLLADGLIEWTVPDKPNSRLQKYKLTRKGKNALNSR